MRAPPPRQGLLLVLVASILSFAALPTRWNRERAHSHAFSLFHLILPSLFISFSFALPSHLEDAKIRVQHLRRHRALHPRPLQDHSCPAQLARSEAVSSRGDMRHSSCSRLKAHRGPRGQRQPMLRPYSAPCALQQLLILDRDRSPTQHPARNS